MNETYKCDLGLLESNRWLRASLRCCRISWHSPLFWCTRGIWGKIFQICLGFCSGMENGERKADSTVRKTCQCLANFPFRNCFQVCHLTFLQLHPAPIFFSDILNPRDVFNFKKLSKFWTCQILQILFNFTATYHRKCKTGLYLPSLTLLYSQDLLLKELLPCLTV